MKTSMEKPANYPVQRVLVCQCADRVEANSALGCTERTGLPLRKAAFCKSAFCKSRCGCKRDRRTSTRMTKPASVARLRTYAEEPACAHSSLLRWHFSTRDAHVFAQESSASTSRTVGVFSTARRKRNQVVSDVRRASGHAIFPKSKTTAPKPPP